LLLGLNFYGYDYTAAGGSPILGNALVEALSTLSAKITYDQQSAEHFFEYK
jgi:spore germination protein YaaH